MANSPYDMEELMLQYATLFRWFDTDASLFSLHQLVQRLIRWREEILREIDATRSGSSIDPDLGHESVYHDAVTTHALMGAVAPFVEGTLAHGFIHLRQDFDHSQSVKTHPRWQCGDDEFWCYKVICRKDRKPKAGIVDGFFDLINALGAIQYFPSSIQASMAALFTYRNTCFHNGYEWPKAERDKFEKKRRERGWEHWFEWSRWGNDLWVASATDEFFTECTTLCEGIVQGFESTRMDWTRANRLLPALPAQKYRT